MAKKKINSNKKIDTVGDLVQNLMESFSPNDKVEDIRLKIAATDKDFVPTDEAMAEARCCSAPACAPVEDEIGAIEDLYIDAPIPDKYQNDNDTNLIKLLRKKEIDIIKDEPAYKNLMGIITRSNPSSGIKQAIPSVDEYLIEGEIFSPVECASMDEIRNFNKEVAASIGILEAEKTSILLEYLTQAMARQASAVKLDMVKIIDEDK